MAITISEVPGGRSGARDARWNRTYSRRFRAVIGDSDSNLTGIKAILDALAAQNITIGTVYAIGSPGDAWYEVDYGAYVTSIEVAEQSEADDGRSWDLTVQYGPWEPREQCPLDEPVQFGLDFATRDEAVDIDQAGNAIVNSAWDAFDPPVTRETNQPILTFTRLEPAAANGQPNYALINAFKDRVNSVAWNGFPARSVKFNAPPIERLWHGEVAIRYPASRGWYFRVQYRFSIRPDLWDAVLLNQGYRFKSGSARKVATVDGLPVSEPVLLDATGAITTTPNFLTFQVYQTADFNQLGLV
jgi:hypothetical protein